eukprot:gene21115-29050_t
MAWGARGGASLGDPVLVRRGRYEGRDGIVVAGPLSVAGVNRLIRETEVCRGPSIALLDRVEFVGGGRYPRDRAVTWPDGARLGIGDVGTVTDVDQYLRLKFGCEFTGAGHGGSVLKVRLQLAD